MTRSPQRENAPLRNGLVALCEGNRVAPRRFCKGHEPRAKRHARGVREPVAVGREIDQNDQRVVELARHRVSVSISDVAVNHCAPVWRRVRPQGQFNLIRPVASRYSPRCAAPSQKTSGTFPFFDSSLGQLVVLVGYLE